MIRAVSVKFHLYICFYLTPYEKCHVGDHRAKRLHLSLARGDNIYPPPWIIFAIVSERLGMDAPHFQHYFPHQFQIFKKKEPSPIVDVTWLIFRDPCMANFDDTDGTFQAAAENRVLEINTNYEHGGIEVWV